MGSNLGYLLKYFLLHLLFLQKPRYLNWFYPTVCWRTSFHEKCLILFSQHLNSLQHHISPAFTWRIFLVEKNSVLCLLFTSFFSSATLFLEGSVLNFSSPNKWKPVKIMNYISKALGLVQVCAKICYRYLVKIQVHEISNSPTGRISSQLRITLKTRTDM